MLTKLLTVSAFTLALTTGAMAQTGDAGASAAGSAGATVETGSGTAGVDASGGMAKPTDPATTGSTNTGVAATQDDDRCSETSAEKTTSVPSGTIPEAACED
ncbi:conserved exported protein of unknown function [Pseudorhizobium banfieldiae]|uniref:Secreted protein n=1 Tax=Pseudorhizobium banfieldiae TaxID=1125847 RepID=L0NDU4_9HYPH|nr:hypothetical protein [Pseudorhizobium banfieldiae]CAD6606718.1 hypothetical protein RNT25_01929 [arsenite-oxidising bacterium NT-25]CAD6614457.1 hypothetical protein RTCK_02655 [Rhizobium sp. TCK]CCF19278.1 conserved exported protein of unknown function [Pseudorhizobium banfieldiae]